MTDVDAQLAALKAQLEGSYEETKKAVEEESRGFVDERILKLDVGQTKVRILPPLKGKSLPWIKKFNHMFVSNSSGKLVAFDCPTTDNKVCKICQFNRKLWDSGTENDITMARRFKRRAAYIANVYVKSNPAKSDDNDSVKAFRFGAKIHDKLVASLNENLVGMYYDPTTGGADFIVVKKIVKSGNNEWANYDDSTFIKGDALHEDTSRILSIIEDAYDLDEFGPKYIENDQDLEKAFNQHILGKGGEELTKAVDEVADQAKDTPQVEQKDTSEAEKPEVEVGNIGTVEGKDTTTEEAPAEEDTSEFLDNLISDLDNLDE